MLGLLVTVVDDSVVSNSVVSYSVVSYCMVSYAMMSYCMVVYTMVGYSVMGHSWMSYSVMSYSMVDYGGMGYNMRSHDGMGDMVNCRGECRGSLVARVGGGRYWGCRGVVCIEHCEGYTTVCHGEQGQQVEDLKGEEIKKKFLIKYVILFLLDILIYY